MRILHPLILSCLRKRFVQSRGIVGPRIEDAVFSNAVQHRKYFGRGCGTLPSGLGSLQLNKENTENSSWR